MDNSAVQRVKQRYGIVGNCEALNRAIEIALKIAPVDLSVLVVGENGVGKESFPRIIHDHSLRKNKKYFAVNCGAIPEGTIDSELFGHEKGAFTGAVDQREGYFAAANGGTLFLDEVGELPLQTQARLLRVLETGEYIRVGSSEVRKTDVRIVAATNVNMEKAIAEGKFREDLYYRLNTVSIAVPALRERGDDAALLFRKFALDMSERYKMPAVRLTPEAQRMLVSYSWPGNVRQLKNLAENMSVTAEEREITPEVLSRYLPSESHSKQIVMVGEPAKDTHSFEAEREILYQILFDLRREVNELKRYVSEQRNGSDHAAADCVAKPNNLILEDQDHTVKFAEDGAQDLAYWEAEEVKDDEPAKPADGIVP
ncbi:MAG: sigma-54-dependent Fis family transcriptional regulator, partial [Prevotellamassilia sp.]|nr:sigma-54-dependent Fis family transcriptional regulator [Prevotellamassilia sp.]